MQIGEHLLGWDYRRHHSPRGGELSYTWIGIFHHILGRGLGGGAPTEGRTEVNYEPC